MRRALIVLLLVACSGKKKAPPPAPAPQPSPAAAAQPGGKRAPIDFNVSCDRFLTKELLAEHFPGMTLDPGGDKVEAWSRTCRIEAPGRPAGTTVQISCGDPYVNEQSMKAQREQAALQQLEPVPDLGRWAARRGGDLRMWDKDAPCFFIVSRFSPPEKVVDFARDLEAASGEDDFDKPPE